MHVTCELRTELQYLCFFCAQIIIPHFMENHHTVYVMNKYTGLLEIFDSRRYSGLQDLTRGQHHQNRVEIVCFFLLLCLTCYSYYILAHFYLIINFVFDR